MKLWSNTGRADGRRRRGPEKEVDARIMQAARTLGFVVSRFQQPRRSGVTAGVPDLYLVHPPWKLAIWVELKAPGGMLSPAQRAWHETARAAGVPVICVRSVADLVEALVELGAPLGTGRGRGVGDE